MDTSTVFADGYLAFRRGESLASNPYKVTDPNQFEDYTEWRRGWLKAHKEHDGDPTFS